MSITYSECMFVALVTQYVMRKRLMPHFPTLCINGTIFEKRNVIEYKLCLLIFSKTSVRYISDYKKNPARYDHKCKSIFM